MRNEPTDRHDELHRIVDEKLTGIMLEMEAADWSMEDVASAINDVLRRKWLDRIATLQRARDAVPQNFLSDGNEG